MVNKLISRLTPVASIIGGVLLVAPNLLGFLGGITGVVQTIAGIILILVGAMSFAR